MEQLRAYTRNPLVTVIAGVVLGLVIGLLIGWVIWPTEWVNAGPSALSPEWQTDFLRMAITDYGRTGNAVEAQERFKALGDNANKVLQEVTLNPGALDPAAIVGFNAAASGQPVAMPPQGPAPTTGAPAGEQPGAPAAGTTPGAEQPGAPAATPEMGAPVPGAEQPMPTDMLMTTPAAAAPTEKGGGLSLLTIFLICLALLVVVGGFAAWWFFFRNKFGAGSGQPTAAQQAVEARRSAQMTNYADSGRSPTAQFMASYQLGDDLFDDSFSIDTETGEFLGECGVSISENIGVGEPKKVTAFEVWLFDKNDIQTVTKVIMSSHGFADTALRQRLEAKGETLEALPGQEFVLETQTLQMVARVTNMQYGAGAMPDESYFENMLLELAVFKKEA